MLWQNRVVENKVLLGYNNTLVGIKLQATGLEIPQGLFSDMKRSKLK